MIPIRDENPTRSFPIATVLIIAANLAVFLYEYSLDPVSLQGFMSRYALWPDRLLAAPLGAAAFSVLTSMFLHAGWLHVLGNMLYLWIFGNNVEDRLGTARFVLFYLASGIVAAVAQVLAAGPASIPVVGASGAIAGVLGAYLVLFPGASVVTLIPIFFFIEVARLPAFMVIGFWFLLQLGNGVASLGAATAAAGGVAWFAHIGGFVAGVLIALVVRATLPDRTRRYYGW
ncbi:MAG: rhomboid family intramembrane serine protease [Anaerosomatales bacterium]|nr:rhomboid family intramembrane serine protease [Anaerosomatales bacterium]